MKRCIAYTDEGNVCGKPANILDLQRGGMVCEEHSRKPTCDFCGEDFTSRDPSVWYRGYEVHRSCADYMYETVYCDYEEDFETE